MWDRMGGQRPPPCLRIPRGEVSSCRPWVQAPASRGGVGPWGSQGEQGGKACEWWGWEDGLWGLCLSWAGGSLCELGWDVQAQKLQKHRGLVSMGAPVTEHSSPTNNGVGFRGRGQLGEGVRVLRVGLGEENSADVCLPMEQIEEKGRYRKGIWGFPGGASGKEPACR